MFKPSSPYPLQILNCKRNNVYIYLNQRSTIFMRPKQKYVENRDFIVSHITTAHWLKMCRTPTFNNSELSFFCFFFPSFKQSKLASHAIDVNATSVQPCWLTSKALHHRGFARLSCDDNICVKLCVFVLSSPCHISSLSSNWANFMVWWADRDRLADCCVHRRL